MHRRLAVVLVVALLAVAQQEITHYMGCNQVAGYGSGGLEAGSDPRGDIGIGQA